MKALGVTRNWAWNIDMKRIWIKKWPVTTRTAQPAIHFHSLWPTHVIWWHRSWPTLLHVMACCLTAPSHRLNLYWLITNGFLALAQFHKKCTRYQIVKWVWKLHIYSYNRISQEMMVWSETETRPPNSAGESCEICRLAKKLRANKIWL